jgi:putative flippase GtrA
MFALVGSSTVLIDFISYRGMAMFSGIDVSAAKAVAFIVGSLFAYCANRFWTFGNKPHAQGSAWRFGVLYSSTLGSNVLINSQALKLLSNDLFAFAVATVTSATINFIGMKAYVFKKSRVSEV